MKPTRKTLLELRRATVRLDDRLVFRRTCWTFRAGQHWIVVGPNGSGKTLFCRALCGECPVVEGEIVYGFRARQGRESEQEIGLLSFACDTDADAPTGAPARWFSLDIEQSPAVSELLGRNRVEGINPFQIVKRAPGDTARWNRYARRVIRLLGVAPLLPRRLLALSNGEQRKVMLARALLRRPRLLVLDDPFQGLDARYRRHLRDVLDALIRRRLVHLLLVSMQPADWPRGMTHVLLMDRLRVVAQGPLRVLRRDPRVARLLDAGPVAPGRAVRAPGAGLRPRVLRTMAGRELIALRAVRVRIGGVAILDGIDWTVRAGESWAVLGPNGAGKSALLSLILGENPHVYANEVRVFGRQRGTGESVWELKRRIGWVSPEFHRDFAAALTGLEAVLTGFFNAAVLHARPTARQRAAAWRGLRRLGIARLADRPFGLVSTGEQRLTLLARALVRNPRLLVLDEPCQGLDARHRRVFVAAVDRLLRQGVTALYITHRRDEIPPAVRRVLRLRRGRARIEHL